VLLREGDAAPPGPTLGGYDAEPLEAREEVVAPEEQTAHTSAPAEAASAVTEPVAEVNAGAPRPDNQGG
jgi:hypothetical protein